MCEQVVKCVCVCVCVAVAILQCISLYNTKQDTELHSYIHTIVILFTYIPSANSVNCCLCTCPLLSV